MKLRASTKIALGFIVLVGGGVGGTKAYTAFKLKSVSMAPIQATDFCLFAIDKNAKVKIITANRMVQIVEVEDSFGGSSSGDEGAGSGSIKARIPMKELLRILSGDSLAVDDYLARIDRKVDVEELSEDAPLWEQKDIEAAMAGDKALKPRLEGDLNITLEGDPLPTLNPTAFYNGIRIKCPVSFNVPNATGKPLAGSTTKAFKPRFLTALYKQLESKFYDKAGLQDYYKQFLLESTSNTKEGVAQNLTGLMRQAANDPKFQKGLTIAKQSTVILNRSMIESAKWEEEILGKETTYNLSLKLTEEGANRLWKFSTENSSKIIVVSKSVPIAAASIGSQLNSRELVIKQIADKTLIQEAVRILQSRL